MYIIFFSYSSLFQILDGNTKEEEVVAVTFPYPVAARYMRVHPLRGENIEGSTSQVNVRVTALVALNGMNFDLYQNVSLLFM